MDWTVNDGLYHRFLKWKLKCENIPDCELAMLPESWKCKKVIAWSVDFGKDQYISWCLPAYDLCLDTIWAKYEDFFKPQLNEVRARFDLLTSFRQGNRSVDEWYDAAQAQVSLAKYPPETASILHQDIFWFFLKDEEFLSKIINDGSIDLEEFPASKVRQLAKKMGASKAMVHHMKQVASDPQAAQINLTRHQQTDLPPSKHKKKQQSSSQDHPVTRGIQVNTTNNKCHPTRRNLILKKPILEKIDVPSVEIQKHVEGFKCPAKRFLCKTYNKHGHFTSLCYKKISVL